MPQGHSSLHEAHSFRLQCALGRVFPRLAVEEVARQLSETAFSLQRMPPHRDAWPLLDDLADARALIDSAVWRWGRVARGWNEAAAITASDLHVLDLDRGAVVGGLGYGGSGAGAVGVRRRVRVGHAA